MSDELEMLSNEELLEVREGELRESQHAIDGHIRAHQAEQIERLKAEEQRDEARRLIDDAQRMIRAMHARLLGADCGCIWCDKAPPYANPGKAR